MTDFKLMVKDKLASNFNEDKLKEAEAFLDRIFLEESQGGPKAVEKLVMEELKLIIDNSGLNEFDIKSFLDELEEWIYGWFKNW